MDLRKVMLGVTATVVVGLASLSLYWVHQPEPHLDGSYPVDVVTQTYGQPSVIKVPQLALIDESQFFVYSTTIDLEGKLIFSTPLFLLNKQADSYSVLTYRNLPIGNYNVVVHIDHSINPLKYSRQKFTLATVSVIGAPNVANDPTAKFICPRYPSKRIEPSVSKPSNDPDPSLYNGA